GHTLIYASDKVSPVYRILDMLKCIVANQRKVQLALIDVYSTTGFYYAWLCSFACRVLGIPYITIIRGGNMPRRLQTSQNLCKHVFNHSITTITLSAYMQSKMQHAGYSSRIIPNSFELAIYQYKSRT